MNHGLQLIPASLLAVFLAGPGATAAPKPLRVFILAGQSNMQGQAKVTTFEHIGMDPATQPMLAEMQNADGTQKVCERVWISSIGCADAEQTGKRTVGFGTWRASPGASARCWRKAFPISSSTIRDRRKSSAASAKALRKR